MSNQPTVHIENLSFTHPGETSPLLSNLSLTVNLTETLAIRGPSGGGKTTLLNLIAGLILPDSGSIQIQGREITSLSPGDRALLRGQRIGYAYQDARLLPQLDVVTNVAWPLLFGPISRRKAVERSQHLLDRLRLGHLSHHRPTTLSGGEQRRVAVARALIASPPLLLVDEPTANLDDDSASDVLELLRQAQGEFQTATLLISHSESALNWADRRLVLSEGRLVEETA